MAERKTMLGAMVEQAEAEARAAAELAEKHMREYTPAATPGGDWGSGGCYIEGGPGHDEPLCRYEQRRLTLHFYIPVALELAANKAITADQDGIREALGRVRDIFPQHGDYLAWV